MTEIAIGHAAVNDAPPVQLSCAEQEFFYSIMGFNLNAGNKAAGFVLKLSTRALQQLRHVPVTVEQQLELIHRAQERIGRAGVLSKRLRESCTIALVKNSGCPLAFITDPSFGASIGGNPDDLDMLTRPDAVDWLGPVTYFTPHNCDAPKQALALFILVETWAEWAHGQLLLRGANLAQE